jgi:hypothetical protein
LIGPDKSLDHLLDNKYEAVDYFFKDEISMLNFDKLNDFNHYYALNAVVFEICYMGTAKPFYEMI